MGLFKSIKKRFKKVGSSIAKRMRKIGRGVKKGFKKITFMNIGFFRFRQIRLTSCFGCRR